MNSRTGVDIFYRFVLPGLTVANLGLGLVMLTMVGPGSIASWLELVTGAFCCAVAGWLAGAAWSKWYWGSAMERQVRTWHRVVDAMFRWLEEAPVPVDSLRVLKRSVDKAIVE
jgi:hypothetical protein